MAKPVFSDLQIADQLTRDGNFWYGNNGDNVIRYSFSSSLGSWWGNDSEYALNSLQQQWVVTALDQLESFFGLDFRQVSQPSNTNSNPPTDIIQFVNDTNTGTYSSSYNYTSGPALDGIAFNAIVLDQTWSSNQASNIDYGSYGFMTILHEILHSLGMEHPGDYNAGSGSGPITYQGNAEFAQDTHRFTIMSYFSAEEDGSGAIFYDTMAQRWVYPRTPMIYDILAMTEGGFDGNFTGYATNLTTRNGDTVYGHNASAGIDEAYDFDQHGAPVLTIYDTGGIDTLDLSGDSVTTRLVPVYNASGEPVSYSLQTRIDTLIDLREGGYSSTHGMTYNIGIAFGTIIENAIGTAFDDTVFGNSAGNVISTLEGIDIIETFEGEDIVFAGDGNDIIAGGDDADSLYGEDGNDELFGEDGNDSLFGGAGNDELTGGAGIDYLDGGTGTDTAYFEGLASAHDLVRFGDVVQVFQSGSNARDWTVATELIRFDDVTINQQNLTDHDVYSYLAGYRDLLSAFGTNANAGIRHYYNYGHNEGRSLDAFDEWSYLASNTDILATLGVDAAAATFHYVDVGYEEGRAIDAFDEWSYLASHGDLIRAFGANGAVATSHYVRYGYGEKRAVDKFDEWSYLASNTDLLELFGGDGVAATFHYVDAGYEEGRAKDSFDEWTYLASYGDLIRAFGENGTAATYHYVRYGYGEGRSLQFDAEQYLANYEDLQEMFGNDLMAATIHYVTDGYYEGRTDDILVV